MPYPPLHCRYDRDNTHALGSGARFLAKSHMQHVAQLMRVVGYDRKTHVKLVSLQNVKLIRVQASLSDNIIVTDVVRLTTIRFGVTACATTTRAYFV